MCYVVVSITFTGKKVHAVFANLSDAGDFARMNNIPSWHIEEVPYVR
jgi:hypothetical protein